MDRWRSISGAIKISRNRDTEEITYPETRQEQDNKIPLEERNFRGNAVWKLVEYAWTWLILDATVNKQQKVSQITKG